MKTCPLDRSANCNEDCAWFDEANDGCQMLLTVLNIETDLDLIADCLNEIQSK